MSIDNELDPGYFDEFTPEDARSGLHPERCAAPTPEAPEDVADCLDDGPAVARRPEDE